MSEQIIAPVVEPAPTVATPTESVATPIAEPVIANPAPTYNALNEIKQAEDRVRLEIEKAKSDAINASKENTVDKQVMANIMEQQQAQMDAKMLELTNAHSAQMTELKGTIDSQKSVPTAGNPNTPDKTPRELGDDMWDDMNPSQRATWLMKNARDLKVHFDTHPYGGDKYGRE